MRSSPCTAGTPAPCAGAGAAEDLRPVRDWRVLPTTCESVGSQTSTGDRELTGLRSSDSRLPEPGAGGVAAPPAAGGWRTLLRLPRVQGNELRIGSPGGGDGEFDPTGPAGRSAPPPTGGIE